MRNSLNKVMLIGNVGRDPELRYTQDGVPLATFRLAMTETWRDRDGSLREHTEWHTIVAWRELAERIHRVVQKGARVYIEGRLRTREFEDRGGNRRREVEIWADSMLLLERRSREGQGNSAVEGATAPDVPYDADSPVSPEDEVPF
ncbi:MAG: single-stranded DNA-binding protein [Candidatus Kapabacteria bacterium]|nr:single-stranded DNA-binding protein [Candidatus Kapabacteria bacterium]MCS7170155.1 single-stranded DNA-binding protein [Candidatus Kapabacteria bacterium]MDW7996830.1 single-stranded DNA-binding protein [Bacteroidota bacterium]MDW8225278.1 single-stranded DNA-binding protein [Bacteroidota bacterium]